MGGRTDIFDLGALRLSSGEGRRLELMLAFEPFALGNNVYCVNPPEIPVQLQVSRTTGQGYAVRVQFSAALSGPCMRCLEPATPSFDVDAREVSQPGAGEELDSPYVKEGVVDLAAWARDSFALTLPAAVLCQPSCAGLCPACGENLNRAAADHHHDPLPDPRWAKLSELRFD